MKKLLFWGILIFGILLLLSGSLYFIFLQQPTSDDLRIDEAEKNFSLSSSITVIKEGNLTSIDLGIDGMRIKEFSVDNINTDNLDYKDNDFDLRNEFKKTKDGIKHDIYLTNNQLSKKQFNFSTIIEIDYSEIRWNGTRYKLIKTPIRLTSWLENGKLIVPNIFMDDKFNKRINYKDIAEKGGYAIAYESKGDYFIELKLDNVNIKSLEEYYIDPTYTNLSDGFSVVPIGGTLPQGIFGNETDFWIVDYTDKFVYHTTRAGTNLTQGFSTSGAGANFPTGIWGNGTDLFVVDYEDSDAYRYLYNGTYLGSIDTGVASNRLTGIWGNDSNLFFTNPGDLQIYVTTHAGSEIRQLNVTDSGTSHISGIWGDTITFFVTDSEDNFVYNFQHNGTNLTGGFDTSIFGAASPRGIFIERNDIWIVDQIDDFVYHVLRTYPLFVELISPPNNIELEISSGYSINFVGDFNTSGNLILYNTTLYIWNETDDVIKSRFIEIDGGTNNRTNLTISNLDYGTYLWNYEACANDTTTVECETASANRTFETTFQYEVNYTEDSFVLLEETFGINVSYNNIVYSSITGTFEYNNTVYTASKKLDGLGYAYFENTLIVPNVNATISLMWNFTISNATSSVKQNTVTYNQTIAAYNIDDCLTHKLLILNYSLKDEDTQTQMVAATENTTIEIDVDIYQRGQRTPIVEFSQNYSEINPAQVCLGNQTLDHNDYEMDVIVRYTATNYVSEYHNIQNFTLTNSSAPQNIDLFDLLTTRSTSFLVTYKDSTFLPEENALLDISRRYIEDGVFRSVEIPKTDAKGQAVAHLVVSETVYTITIKKHGKTLATFDNIMAICDDVLAEDCKINLNAFSTGVKTEDWDTYQNLDYTLSWTPDTREVKLVFTVKDGSSQTMDLNATRFDRFGNLTVCSDTITSSSGTITCIVPQSYGNITILAYVYKSGELITTAIYKIFPPPEETFGGTVYILLLIMMLTLPLMFITSAVGVIIGAILGLVMAALLNVYSAGSWLGVGSTIAWLIIAGGILIWKISQRARG